MKDIKGTPCLSLRLKISLKQSSKHKFATVTGLFKLASFCDFLMQISPIFTKYLRIS